MDSNPSVSIVKLAIVGLRAIVAIVVLRAITIQLNAIKISQATVRERHAEMTVKFLNMVVSLNKGTPI